MPNKDPEKRRIQRRAYYAANREVIRSKANVYYAAHSSDILKAERERRARLGPDRKQAANRAWRAARPNYGWESNLRYNYGLTLEQYTCLLKEQGGVCAICGDAETAKNNKGEVRQLSVDHCHSTEKIRALLCHSCNTMLGQGKDSPALLRRAAAYLEQHAGAT